MERDYQFREALARIFHPQNNNDNTLFAEAAAPSLRLASDHGEGAVAPGNLRVRIVARNQRD